MQSSKQKPKSEKERCHKKAMCVTKKNMEMKKGVREKKKKKKLWIMNIVPQYSKAVRIKSNLYLVNGGSLCALFHAFPKNININI